MEGLLTLIVAVLSFFFVHDWPDKARFLTPVEREMVFQRLRREQGLANEGKFNSGPVIAALTDYKVRAHITNPTHVLSLQTFTLMLIYIGACEPLYSGSLFSPTIIAALGKWTTPQSLLLTTPRKSMRRPASEAQLKTSLRMLLRFYPCHRLVLGSLSPTCLSPDVLVSQAPSEVR